MRKFFNSIVLASFLAAVMILSSACTPSVQTVRIIFDENYVGGSSTVVETAKGELVTPPDDPERDNFEFTGWYTDKNGGTEVDFEYTVSEDATYYAAWKQIAATVTFDVNYEGGENFTSVVKIGATVAQPADPERENYLFNGWYTDMACTMEYDFSVGVTADTSVYAKWSEDKGDNVTLIYYWNYEGAENNGVYSKSTFAKNSKTKAPLPAREGYYFAGWYMEEDCSNAFNFNNRVTESANLYAKWQKTNTFEAEYLDVSGLKGSGYSGEYAGTNMIFKDVYDAKASNGFFLTCLYQEYISVTFTIESDKAVDDAVLQLRLSAEFISITLTDEEFLVEVNGEKVSYDPLTFKLENVPSEKKLPFTNTPAMKGIHLNEGVNVITLTVNNATHMQGTMYAKAPMIDCIYVHTDAVLTWDPVTENIVGK